MFNAVTKKFIRSHTKQIIKDGVFQVIWISLLIGFLLYLLHILVGLSFWVQNMSQNIQDKLGVYFYIKEIPNQKDQTYSKVIEMKDKLEKLGMKVQYLSKDDAIKSIERKVPSILESFEKYGIKNPLPATVYVLFNNIKDYDKLKAIVTMYEDIISNRDDISKIGESIKKQEARVLNTLSLTKLVVLLSLFLIAVIVVIVCSFLMLTIKTKFDAFRKMIGIQQLLWTPYVLIKMPFLLVISLMTFIWFMVSLLLRFLTAYLLQKFSIDVFDSWLFTMMGVLPSQLLWIQLLEWLWILVIVLFLWYFYMRNLLLKYDK